MGRCVEVMVLARGVWQTVRVGRCAVAMGHSRGAWQVCQWYAHPYCVRVPCATAEVVAVLVAVL